MSIKTKIGTKKKYWLILVLTAGVVFTTSAFAASVTDDAEEVVEKTAQRVLSYPEITHFKFSATSTMHEMDKNWKSKKKTVVKKVVLVKDDTRQESIKSAVEIKKGKTKDVTQKYINESYKKMEKAARQRKEAREEGEEKNTRHRTDISIDEILPFNEKNRGNYEFSLLAETTLDDVPVYVLDARAKQRTKDFFEGKFYINRETFDIHRAELQLAKNPGPLKLMEMAVDFQVLPEGFLVLKKMSFRIHVGLVVKNIRREGTEEYFDYQFLE